MIILNQIRLKIKDNGQNNKLQWKWEMEFIKKWNLYEITLHFALILNPQLVSESRNEKAYTRGILI